MAMIDCRECGKQISDESVCCVHCGHPTTQGGDIDKRCIRCGAWLRQDYCPKCGYSAIKSKKTRKTLVIALLSFAVVCVVAIIVIMTIPTNNADQNNPTPSQSTATTARTYQSVLDEYSEKLRTATPILIDEYNAEAAVNTDGLEGLALISSNKMEKLAEISSDGIEKMAELMLTTGSGSYDEYQEWANKLTNVYMEESGKITEAYMNSVIQ